MLFRSSVYVQGVDGGAARRLPIAGDPPSLPGWSPDGTRLAYVTWSEQGGGAVWTIAADGAAPPVKISDIPAFYRSEEHTSELQSLMRISYAVFCLKKKTTKINHTAITI